MFSELKKKNFYNIGVMMLGSNLPFTVTSVSFIVTSAIFSLKKGHVSLFSYNFSAIFASWKHMLRVLLSF